MRATDSICLGRSARSRFLTGRRSGLAWVLIPILLVAGPASAADLKVMKMGLGSGTVASNPPGINCGADCDESYASGVSVTLMATPAAGSAFSHWEGDASGM